MISTWLWALFSTLGEYIILEPSLFLPFLYKTADSLDEILVPMVLHKLLHGLVVCNRVCTNLKIRFLKPLLKTYTKLFLFA